MASGYRTIKTPEFPDRAFLAIRLSHQGACSSKDQRQHRKYYLAPAA